MAGTMRTKRRRLAAPCAASKRASSTLWNGIRLLVSAAQAGKLCASHQSFSLVRHVAEFKFGPHYVACKTPLDNIRLTTFFAGENEVRVVSPHRLMLLEAHGCRVECSEALREATRQ
jgi:hypothetical protein